MKKTNQNIYKCSIIAYDFWYK